MYARAWYQDYQNGTKSKLGIKNDDFFPYADIPGWVPYVGYWTGYFTSKAHIKILVRESSQKLNAFRKIYAKHLLNHIKEAGSNEKWKIFDSALDKLERAIGVTQHHDGVSGTSKVYVTSDYMAEMNRGIERNIQIVSNLSQYDFKERYNETLNFDVCKANSSSANCENFFQKLSINGVILYPLNI